MTKDPLAELAALIERQATIALGEGDYAELVNEDEPDGYVRVCRKDGTPVIFAPRALWDKLRGGP